MIASRESEAENPHSEDLSASKKATLNLIEDNFHNSIIFHPKCWHRPCCIFISQYKYQRNKSLPMINLLVLMSVLFFGTMLLFRFQAAENGLFQGLQHEVLSLVVAENSHQSLNFCRTVRGRLSTPFLFLANNCPSTHFNPINAETFLRFTELMRIDFNRKISKKITAKKLTTTVFFTRS